MNPKATLRQLLQAIHDGDRRLAQDLSWVFSDWLKRRGFLPSPADLAEVCAEFATSGLNP